MILLFVKTADGITIKMVFTITAHRDVGAHLNTGSFLWFSTSPFCRTGPTSDPASLPRTGLSAYWFVLRWYRHDLRICPSPSISSILWQNLRSQRRIWACRGFQLINSWIRDCLRFSFTNKNS